MGDHLIWVLVSSRAPYGDADPKAMDGESIRRLALRMTDNWHPVLRNLIADSDPGRISAVPVLTSIPIEPWEPTNITLLGDAIHTMTPLQGLGGSSALRDAGLLCRELIEAHQGTCTPTMAIRRYEKAMINYGFAAVRRSAWVGRIVVSRLTETADRPRSDALKDVRASHPYHATIRADICRDPSRNNGRRADEASRPYRRYSAIRRPIPRCLEHHPRTLNAPHHIIGDCRTWTHWAAEENSGEISGSWVDRQNFQD
jgi:hypothetical protein